MPDKVTEFNEKVAALIKEASPADLVGILKDDRSLLRAHQNNNQQGKAAPEK